MRILKKNIMTQTSSLGTYMSGILFHFSIKMLYTSEKFKWKGNMKFPRFQELFFTIVVAAKTAVAATATPASNLFLCSDS